MGKWNAGLPPLTRKFNDDLKVVKDQVEERHSGVSGWFVAGWDAVTGMPRKITKAYDDAEQNFGDGVCALITDISRYVNGIIKIADEIIADRPHGHHHCLHQRPPRRGQGVGGRAAHRVRQEARRAARRG